MKALKRYTFIALAIFGSVFAAVAQDDNSSVVRRRGAKDREQNTSGPQVTQRMQQFYEDAGANLTDADINWMRVIYRQIDLDKDQNAPLYFPAEPIDGQQNLFRIILGLLAENKIPAYEYLDGREIFTDQYKVKLRDVLDRFYILYTEAKGSTEKNPKFNIDESDVPANEVLSYYLIERWEFDTRSNRMKTRVEAICPVLHRDGDFGGEAVKYPMFWVKFDDLRPWLAQQPIFVSDDNNLPSCSYDDFFNLTMYDGDIYKTRNLRNKSMMQLYPDPDDRRRAQDSIQNRLQHFEDKLWVPNREEVIASSAKSKVSKKGNKDNDTEIAAETETPEEAPKATRSSKRSTKKPTKVKEPKSSSSSSSSATRSVRNRKK